MIVPGLNHLPGTMDSPEARAFLLAIGSQESRWRHRKQIRGSAVSFYQFEKAGVRGVLNHPRSSPHARAVVKVLEYTPTDAIQAALKDNDPLATVFARLLLWTLPQRLPGPNEPDLAWRQYLDSWAPGKPHHHTWARFYREAWEVV